MNCCQACDDITPEFLLGPHCELWLKDQPTSRKTTTSHPGSYREDASDMGKEVNGVSRSRFEMFTNSDEAVINKKLPKELLL
ncbi:F-box/LRR-repeat protein 20, partial [Lates japonicus]